MGDRRRGRELALQMLYRHELSGEQTDGLEEDFEALRKVDQQVRTFSLGLFGGVVEHLTEIDAELEQQTSNWRLDRLAAVDRNILRLATFELLFETQTPPAVVINEAIEIAKRFGSDQSPRFINGVLDGLRRRKRSS